MAIKGKDGRNQVLEKLLSILWAGNVDGAVGYLESLPPSMIKKPEMAGRTVPLSGKEERQYNLLCREGPSGITQFQQPGGKGK